MKRATDSHSPTRFKTYRQTHDSVFNKFIDRGFVSDSTLEFCPYPNAFRLAGEIACLGEILIQVDKFLDILEGCNDDAIVCTRWYAYNVSIKNYGNVFRYDNQDPDYLRDGHLDEHHKHLFDWRLNVECLDSPKWIGESGWLTLGQVIEEAHDWYWQNQHLLPKPDSYCKLKNRGSFLHSNY